MKLSKLADQKFSCNTCTQCCRDWHVSLSKEEVDRLKNFSWKDSSTAPKEPILYIARKPYINHKDNSACIYLNEINGLCRIHEEFGEESKPLGCRVYPYKFTRTFDDEIAVSSRFDCPTIRQNKGKPFKQSAKALQSLANEINFNEPFSEKTCGGLKRNSLEIIIPFLIQTIEGIPTNTARISFLYTMSNRLEKLGAEFLNDDKHLKEDFLKPIAADILADKEPLPVAIPGVLPRSAFRLLMTCYLRRDEDLINNKANRLSRVKSIASWTLGEGDLKDIGDEHLSGFLSKSGLFNAQLNMHNKVEISLFWRFVFQNLNSWNFMGASNHGKNFFEGLKSLCLLYPLVIAVAKYYQGNRSNEKIHFEDLDKAVAAISHSYGQSNLLKSPFVAKLENYLLSPKEFNNLILTI